VRIFLRNATAELHAELDSRLAPLIKQGDAGYARFLLRSAAALLPMERALAEANVAALLPDWPLRSRSRAIRLDLAALALREPSPLPAPEVRSEAFQFGMLYVLEGSRLGARLVLREAQAELGEAVRVATRYLSHGQGQPFWPTFLRRLEKSSSVRRQPELTVAGARAAFRYFLIACDNDHSRGVDSARD
jgi:heme oxygenase